MPQPGNHHRRGTYALGRRRVRSPVLTRSGRGASIHERACVVFARFLVGVIALLLTSREASDSYSFGYGRAEVLGALASISIVWAMTAMLLFEAVQRLIVPVCAVASAIRAAHLPPA